MKKLFLLLALLMGSVQTMLADDATSEANAFTTDGIALKTAPTDGYYVVQVYSKNTKGYLTHNSSLGRPYRVSTSATLSGLLDRTIVWQLTNGTDGSVTLRNIGTDAFLPADATRNSNCTATETAHLILEALPSSTYAQADSWFAYQSNYTNGGNKLYLHCNAPADGYGNNLSYWDGNGLSDGGSVCQFAFLPAVTAEGHTITLNYTYKGTTFKTLTVLSTPGATIVAPAVNGYTFTALTQTATADATIEVPCTPILPAPYYYIANDNENGGKDIKLQLSDENGTLKAMVAEDSHQEKYIWKCTVDADGYYQFQNLATGRYLKHKGVQEAAYNFRLEDGIAAGNYALWSLDADRHLCIKYDGTLDQATGTFNKATTNYSTDFIFEEAVINTLTITSKPAISGIFTWNGTTKLGPTVTFANIMGATPASTEVTAADNGYRTTLSATAWDGQGDLKVTATVTPAFLTSEADYAAGTNIKWVRIENVRNAYALKAVSGEGNLHSAVTDVAADGQLFAVVGTSLTRFKLYSKVYGGKAFGYVGTTEGTAVTYGGTATTFKATFNSTNSCPGYNITPTANTAQSLNMYGGAGADIKFYGTSDGGSTWRIVPVDGQTISIAIAAENPYANNYQMAKLTTTYGNTSSTSIIRKTDVGSKTLYVPKGLSATLSVDYQYHGYTTAIDGTNVTFAYDGTAYQYLWYEHPDYQFYRIPAIVTDRKGRLIAFSDYRYCHNDIGFGRVDQYMRTSSDNGKTWTDPQLVLEGSDGTPEDIFYKGFGDPALCADSESDRLLLMTVAGNNFYGYGTTNYWNGQPNYFSRTYSEDGGRTWSQPENITDDIYRLFASESTDGNAVTKAFVGSGKIFQSRIVKIGSYYRLYAALCAAPGGNRVIYSDDFGQTWAVLGGADARPAPAGDEPKCEELPDGSVILSSRKYYGRYFNIFTYSAQPSAATPAAGAWGDCVASHDMTGGISVGGNSTNGEIIIVRARKANDDRVYTVALQSLPFGSNRSQVGLYWKDITDTGSYQTGGINSPAVFASNWTRGIQVENIGYSAYSTFTIQADGKVGFFYEESPGTYAMVYIPLSISEITDGAYTEIIPFVISPSETDEDAITPPSAHGRSSVTAVYDLSGSRHTSLGKGINILQYTNGHSSKVVVR